MSFMAEVIAIPSFICIICVACRRTLRRSASSAPVAGHNAAPVCHGDRIYLFFEKQQLKSKRSTKLACLVQHPKPSLDSGELAVEYTAITSPGTIFLSFAFIFFSVRCGGWLKKPHYCGLGKRKALRRGPALVLLAGEVEAPCYDRKDHRQRKSPYHHDVPSILRVSNMHPPKATTAITIPKGLLWKRPTAKAATLTFSSQSANLLTIPPP